MSQIVEINGIKMAIDERTAKIQKVDTFKVGDPVKLLLKNYSNYEVKYAVIIGFDMFVNRPTITLAYLDYSTLKYAQIYNGSESEIVACDDHDLVMEKQWVLDQMQARIKQKENELAEEKSKFENFKNMFGKYFENGTPDASKIG